MSVSMSQRVWAELTSNKTRNAEIIFKSGMRNAFEFMQNEDAECGTKSTERGTQRKFWTFKYKYEYEHEE